MKLSELSELSEYFQTDLYEMSNYNSDDTGLSSNIRLWIREEPRGLPHTKYRIKFDHPQNGTAIFSLWGDEAQQVAGNWNVGGKDLKKILYLIQSTNVSLRKHIDGQISSGQLAMVFAKVKELVTKI
jgi:hypothetical protein